MSKPMPTTAFALVACVVLLLSSVAAVTYAEVPSSPRKQDGPSPLSAYGYIVGASDLARTIQLAHKRGYSPANLNATLSSILSASPGASGPTLFSEAGDILEGCAATAITGGILGGIFGGVAGLVGGLLAGCAIGALTAYQAYEDGLTAAELAQQNVAQQFVLQEQTAINNEVNLTSQLLTTLASALNATQYGMDAWAETAATSQLGNATFSQALDLTQTEIPYDLAVPMELLGSDIAAIANSTMQWWMAKYGANGEFANLCGPGNMPTGQGLSAPYLSVFHTIACTSTSYVQSTPLFAYSGGAAVGHGDAFIAMHGGELYINGTAGDTLTQLTGGSYTLTPANGKADFAGFPGPTGVYSWPGTVTGLVAPLEVPGATNTQCYTIGALESGTPDATNLAHTGGAGIAPCGIGLAPLGLSNSPADTTVFYASAVTSTFDYYQTQAKIMEANAENGAQFYWQFLRSLGYTNASQIPAQCIIPEPYLSLPPSINLGNITVGDYEAIYDSWTQAVANYYGVNASKISDTCTNNRNPGGNGPFWVTNLTVNSTLSVYIANSTEYPSENLSNLSSWAYDKVQAVWWPELAQFTLPVGQVTAVPSNDPIQVVIPSRSAFLTLTGDGPKVKGAVHPLTSGDYIFVWTCTINGQPTSNCTVGPENISKTFYNISCGGGSSQCGLQQSPPFILTLPNWLAGIEQFFSSIFGGGAIGALLGSLLTDFIIIAAVVLAVYAVYRVVSYKGRGRGGGSGPTYIVAGGRK